MSIANVLSAQFIKTVQIFTVVFALAVVCAALPMQARAAALTEPQIQAILSLLSSFGADPDVVANVARDMRGGSSFPTVDLKVNASDGPVAVIDNQPIVITWSTTNPNALDRCNLLGVRLSPGADLSGVPASRDGGTLNAYASKSAANVVLSCNAGVKEVRDEVYFSISIEPVPTCQVVDIYAEIVPGKWFYNFYMKVRGLSGTGQVGITGSDTWNNLKFDPYSTSGDTVILKANQTVNSVGVDYLLARKNTIKPVSVGGKSVNCQSIGEVSTPRITVEYPNGGEILDNSGANTSGVIAEIHWASSNVNDLVSIALVDTVGNVSKWIATYIKNTGSYTWKHDPSIPDGKYKIYIQAGEEKGSLADYSDNFFELVGSTSTPITFTATPTSGIAPLEVQFGMKGLNLLGTPTAHYLDFGDYSTPRSISADNIGGNVELYTYPQPGTYTARLVKLEPAGCQKCTERVLATAKVVVTSATPPPPPPAMKFTASPTSGNVPLLVTFSHGGLSGTYYVDYGDGSPQDKSGGKGGWGHTYTKAGTYTAKLIHDVCGSNSGTMQCLAPVQIVGTAKVTVTTPVVITTLPTCTLAASPTTVTRGQSVTLKWTTKNATTMAINNISAVTSTNPSGIGTITPVAAGTKVISPTVSTTYGASAVNGTNRGTCSVRVNVTQPAAYQVGSTVLSASVALSDALLTAVIVTPLTAVVNTLGSIFYQLGIY